MSIFEVISVIIRLILTINCHVIGQDMMILEAIIDALSLDKNLLRIG